MSLMSKRCKKKLENIYYDTTIILTIKSTNIALTLEKNDVQYRQTKFTLSLFVFLTGNNIHV